MTKTSMTVALSATAWLALVSVSPSAHAAPSPAASCSGQLSQGATPHGASEAAPGFLGAFVSGTARTAPGAVGDSSSFLARQHGDLGACIPS